MGFAGHPAPASSTHHTPPTRARLAGGVARFAFVRMLCLESRKGAGGEATQGTLEKSARGSTHSVKLKSDFNLGKILQYPSTPRQFLAGGKRINGLGQFGRL